MSRRILWMAGGGLAVAVAIAIGAGGAAALAAGSGTRAVQEQAGETDDGTAGGQNSDGRDAPLAGTALDRAVAAALAHTGGGTVTDTEIGDDGAAYGVEIRKPDGTEVEIGLDANFAVTSEQIDD